MIRFPNALIDAEAALTHASVRAGATDLTERRHLGSHRGDLVDLRDVPGLSGILDTPEGGLRIGAMTPIATLAEDPRINARWPGLAQAALGLATPQIRARATLGGNLLQEVRCWYNRSDQFHCLKAGGDQCLARAGDHSFHSCIDLGACAAPHPSTLALAFLAFDATVEVAGAPRSLGALLGTGSDPRQTHALEAGALLSHLTLPPSPSTHSGYTRTIHRSRSEWPLVEALVAVQVQEETVQRAWVSIGGVANRPLRLPEVEAALIGRKRGEDPMDAFEKVNARANPLPMTGYKVPLMAATLSDAWKRAGMRA